MAQGTGLRAQGQKDGIVGLEPCAVCLEPLNLKPYTLYLTPYTIVLFHLNYHAPPVPFSFTTGDL